MLAMRLASKTFFIQELQEKTKYRYLLFMYIINHIYMNKWTWACISRLTIMTCVYWNDVQSNSQLRQWSIPFSLQVLCTHIMRSDVYLDQQHNGTSKLQPYNLRTQVWWLLTLPSYSHTICNLRYDGCHPRHCQAMIHRHRQVYLGPTVRKLIAFRHCQLEWHQVF